MKLLHTITWVLLIIGGLNWGLEGITNWGIGSFLSPTLAQIVYVLVGISALVELFSHRSYCRHCESVTPAQGL